MITVLRLGHRAFRDRRISTHCGLVARALGAEKLFYSGEMDRNLEESVDSVSRQWGGGFSVEHVKSWKKVIQGFRGKKVHLTMYGMPIQDRIKDIRKTRNLLVIVGGEKVPGDVYQLSDWNLSVSSQPHSEVASLGIFLHEYFRGKELGKGFPGSRIRLIPQERGKKIIEK
jgi:tRNA (cytidine56-2'-O)-methyltransferase